MDALLAVFISWQFMVFCLGIAALTFVFRKLLEFYVLDNPSMPGNRNSRTWRELILPITPVVFGGFAGYLAKMYPYPEGLSGSSYGRISFGLVAGLLSGLVYRVVVALLRAKITVAVDPTATAAAPENLESPFIQSVRNTITINNQSGTPSPSNENPPSAQ